MPKYLFLLSAAACASSAAAQIPDTAITVTATDLSSGKMTRKNSRNGPAPSRIAASSSSFGIVEMNAWKSRIVNDRPNAISIRISPGSVRPGLSHVRRRAMHPEVRTAYPWAGAVSDAPVRHLAPNR